VTRHDAPTAPVGTPVVVADDARPRGEALAGEIAVDVARQLAEPGRALRDRLGLVVDHLERHVATATGPTPYPWRSLQVLRHDLGEAYLEATALARRIEELDRALADDAHGWFELAAAVELGLHLADHHLGGGIEVLIDLGRTAPVRGVAGTLALLIAQLVGLSAGSARALPGSTLSVRVAADGAWGLVAIADNGAGSARAPALGELARGVVAPWGGAVDAASVTGAGCAFELRLATGG
jgi:signal transduction histidine kinase